VRVQAVEQYEEVREKERAQAEDLDAARRVAQEATEAFHAVQQKRHELFTAAFDHVSNAIDPIFKVPAPHLLAVVPCMVPGAGQVVACARDARRAPTWVCAACRQNRGGEPRFHARIPQLCWRCSRHPPVVNTNPMGIH
jgi:hypothetical protein